MQKKELSKIKYELTNWVLSSSIDERKQAKKSEFTRKH